MDHRLLLRDLLIERSLAIGDFTLSSGARSTFYIDARLTTMSAHGQALVGQVGLDAVRAMDSSVRWVGGLTMGADPIAYAIAHRSWLEGDPVDAFSVRKSAKQHGTGRRIEGGLPPGVPVVVIEDTLTTGASALQAVAAVEAHGATVAAILAVVNREEGAGEAIRKAGYPVTALFSASELLEAKRAGAR